MFSMDDEKQKKVLNNFKKVIDKKNIGLLNKDLYYHLNLNCNFDAHFNFAGFREEYDGEEGFSNFINFFNRHSPLSQWADEPEISIQYKDLNNEMINYASCYLDLQNN